MEIRNFAVEHLVHEEMLRKPDPAELFEGLHGGGRAHGVLSRRVATVAPWRCGSTPIRHEGRLLEVHVEDVAEPQGHEREADQPRMCDIVQKDELPEIGVDGHQNPAFGIRMSEQRPIARIGTKLASFENIVSLLA